MSFLLLPDLAAMEWITTRHDSKYRMGQDAGEAEGG